MKAAQDTNNLTMRDHAWLIAFTVLLLGSWIWDVATHRVPDPEPAHGSRYHDASLDLETQPITTPQEYYEREKAALHGLEYTDIETTAEKLDRIRRRDAAARAPTPDR